MVPQREHILEKIDPDTRERVEQAVLEAFSTQVFHRVKLIDVASNAQVSLQTLYKYYGSKEVLLLASLDSWLGELAQRMIDHLEGIETYKDRLRKVFWVMLDYFEQNPQVARIIVSSVYFNTWLKDDSFRQPQLMGVFLKVLHEGREQGVLHETLTEEDLLDFFLGVAYRKITMWLVRDRGEKLADRAPVLFEALWRALVAA